jgi:hypothetical protein
MEVRRAGGLPSGMLVMLVGAAFLGAAIWREQNTLPSLASAPTAPDRPFMAAAPARSLTPFEAFIGQYGLQIVAALAGLAFGVLAWRGNSDNTYTVAGLAAWALSVAAWLIAFGVRSANPSAWAARWRAPRVAQPQGRRNWTYLLLAVILLVGAWFRFSNLSAFPPDMTSDHVEKALDANKIVNGDRSVFFPNNGGRESTQMYLIALAHQLTGLPISHELLKLVSGLEGMLMIVLAFWLGRAIFGEEDRNFGRLVGLIMAALVAVSYWHTMLSRLGLRIVLTTLIATVVLVFLVRALRHNRRADFLLCGLALGGGMYLYQAARMLPLLVVIGLLIGLWRARRQAALARYLFNSTALVIVALAVFVPLARYWSEYPESFWERTGGRFFGEGYVILTDENNDPILDPQGRPLLRDATPEERLAEFQANLPIFFDNLGKSLLMFNVRGDNAWITGDPDGTPELDTFTGAFFILGLGVVVARAVRRRDPFNWLVLPGLLVGVLPSALSIAYTIEVPSATRASGALPLVYLTAALGLATAVSLMLGMTKNRLARYAVIAFVVVGLAYAALTNAYSYFVDAAEDYRDSTFPYRQAGEVLRGFAESTGAPGNAFMIAWDFWWDYRAIGIEAGLIGWPNGILRDDLLARITDYLRFNLGTAYELRPLRQMLFFTHYDDVESIAALREAFPGGEVIPYQSFKPERDFQVYVAPPVGCAWMLENLSALGEGCR